MRCFGLAALLLVAGCGDDSLPPERPDADAVTPSTTLVPPKVLDFTGRWAVRPDMCEAGWWDIGSDKVVTAGELACSILGDERTATSAMLKLSCVGEGLPINETWRIEGDAERITVKRVEADPVTLIRCAR